MWFFKKISNFTVKYNSFNYRIKAGVLQYVLVISVLIVILVFAFISLIYFQQKLQIKNDFYKEVIQNVQFGFDYLNQNEIPYNEIQERKFSKNKLETTTLLKQHWGLFNIVTVKSTIKNEVFKRIGLLGNNNIKRKALFLQENNKPLVLVGNTKIAGNVSLPQQGVKRGNISGISYSGNQLIYGIQNLSSTLMPIIRNLDFVKNLFNQNYKNDFIQYFELEKGMHKTQKFTEPTTIYQINGRITLRNLSLQGNIIIHSSASIKVESSSKLQDIILVAPQIEIDSNTEGNFQAIASKKINVQKNCKLNYPSALVLIDKDKITYSSKENNGIIIDENSDIKGVVLYINESKDNNSNFKQQIIISKNTVITGEVYCSQNLELLGSVFGSIYTSNFITKQFGSTYINHIYNGVIDSSKLPEQYCGLSIDSNHPEVIKWLY